MRYQTPKSPFTASGRPLPRAAVLVAILGVAFGIASVTRLVAGLPEPDVLVYGTVTLDGMAVSGADTGVAIEARRSATGPVVASYRMGSSDQAGDAYVLRLAMESGAPLLDPAASVAGDTLVLVVTDVSGARGQVSFTLPEAGSVRRVDLALGVATNDADRDNLPDSWETYYFGGLGARAEDLMANGQTAFQNFVAGTDPLDAGSYFAVQVSAQSGQTVVAFLARRAEGVGYDGLVRRFALESTTDFAHGWSEVPGFNSITGSNQQVQYVEMADGPPTFYRVRVWLGRP